MARQFVGFTPRVIYPGRYRIKDIEPYVRLSEMVLSDYNLYKHNTAYGTDTKYYDLKQNILKNALEMLKKIKSMFVGEKYHNVDEIAYGYFRNLYHNREFYTFLHESVKRSINNYFDKFKGMDIVIDVAYEIMCEQDLYSFYQDVSDMIGLRSDEFLKGSYVIINSITLSKSELRVYDMGRSPLESCYIYTYRDEIF